jgi:hypothetical protein
MVARIDWLNVCIDNLVAGKQPPPPERWGKSGSIRNKDVDLLRAASCLAGLRPSASELDPGFISQARQKFLAEMAIEE